MMKKLMYAAGMLTFAAVIVTQSSLLAQNGQETVGADETQTVIASQPADDPASLASKPLSEEEAVSTVFQIFPEDVADLILKREENQTPAGWRIDLARSGSSQCLRENAACRQACGTGRKGAAHCRARCDNRLQDCLNGGGGGGGWGGGSSQCLRENAACRQACGTGRKGAAHCRARCDDRLKDCLNGWR